MLKTFKRGGIHPPENKLSAGITIQDITVPLKVNIPLSQHMGVPAKPIVNKGDEVLTGQLIAKGDGFVSSNIHSSVSGKVLKIDNEPDATGYKKPCIIIEVNGDKWIESIEKHHDIRKEITIDSELIIAKIKESGIVGMGGATFPSHVKLSILRGKTAKYLIINGVECEPYLTSDHVLMLEKGEEILVGTSLLKTALKVEKAFIGIENNKTDVIKHLTNLSSHFQGIEVTPLKVKYPQGGEKQLIKAILNREVPSGGLPVDVGAVVFNVATSYAVYEAVICNKPLFERVVTVTGKSLKRPANYRVRIGTPISALIEASGGIPEDTGKIILGGPMMGKAVNDLSVPVTKGTSGVLLLQEKESHRENIEPCIRCSKCISVCPIGLEPYILMPLSQKSMFEELEINRVLDCIECGSCSYICPANRPLLDYIKLGKSNVSKIIRSRKK